MKMTKQMTKALEKLNNAITNLPEFGDVMKLVPSNVAITKCELMECETTRTCSNDTLEEIAQVILTALEKAPKKRDTLEHAISVSNYLRDNLDYYRMHQSTVGEFTLKRFETLL